MLRQIKMLRNQLVRHAVEAGGINQHRAEHGLLRLQAVGHIQAVSGIVGFLHGCPILLIPSPKR